MAWTKPLPDVEPSMLPFWEGLKEHRLLLFRCDECGAWYWPASYCRNHPNKPFFGSLSWVDASGLGTVIAFNVTHRALHPAFAAETPFVYALIQLREGPILSSNVVGCPPSDVHCGLPVRVVYRDVPDIGWTIPYFTPAPSQPAGPPN